MGCDKDHTKKYTTNRMKWLVILCTLVLSSCSLLVSPPGIRVNESPYPVEQVESAIIDFSDAWFTVFEEDIWWTVSDLDIQFYGKDGYTNGCVTGQTDSPGHIRVSYNKNAVQPLALTSIWHELTHSTLWHTEKDPDYTHSQDPGPWSEKHDWLIAYMKANFGNMAEQADAQD